ncbi:hypothetical protein PR202_gb11956 [Eleusine coracana subsp. coracana]|uniref:BHLH domain-containing protein n=1 Tax=Eleusine coracana subsp. coracana TaxID=191504 RepID=A0AAV5EPM9_ELECO|nr:hypothetical protein PR202_gb11956 [Eleusine coracana subsp. coracana]
MLPPQSAISVISRCPHALIASEPTASTVIGYRALIRDLVAAGRLDAVDAALASARSRLAPAASLHPLYVASIRAYARAGRLRDAVDTFERMDLFACTPAAPAYNAIMDALVDAAYHDQAHKVYVRMLAGGVAPNTRTHTIRLRSFCLTGRPHVALRLLRTLPERGCDAKAAAYATVITGLYACGYGHDARHLFDEMLEGHLFPDIPTFNKVLHALCRKGNIRESGTLLAKVLKRGMSVNNFTYNIWIRGLCEGGRLREAVALVQEMGAYIVPDVVTYNTLIRGLCKESKVKDAAQYLRRMMNKGCVPDDFTYNTIIDGYCKMGMVLEATDLLKDAVFKGFVPDRVTYCSLINGLCAEGDVERALELFNEAQAKDLKPDLVVYNSLIMGLCRQGLILHALQVMNEMAEDGCHPDIWTYNIVINGLCKMGNISDATVVMNDAIVKGYLPDVFTFNTLIDGYCKRLKLDCALQLVERMWTYAITPDAITYNSVLNGLCKAGKAKEVNDTFEEMILKGCQPNAITYNILIENFCKVNKLEEAAGVLVRMSQEGLVPDAVSFNTLIHGFCKNGDLDGAYLLFQKLDEKGYSVTADTFNILIGAFSSKLKMQMAEKIFNEMVGKGYAPDSYTYRVLIDGSCKTANVDRAYVLLVEMIDKDFVPSTTTFGRVINSLAVNHRVSEAVGIIHTMVRIGVVPEVVETIFSADKKEIAAPKILVEDLMKKGHISYTTYEVLHEGDDLYLQFEVAVRIANVLADSFGLFEKSLTFFNFDRIIGKVALTGRHCCVSVNELCSASMYMYHEDWKLHFAAGIKKVLLVPVLPYGVLQLGSLDTTFESSALVALIRNLFYKYDVSVSQCSLANASGHSHTLRRLTPTLSIDPPGVMAHDLIEMMESSAQLLTASEFPIFEDVSVGAYRTTPLDPPNGLLDYENFAGFMLTDIAHGYQEHTHVSTTLLNDDFVISNSLIHSEFHKDLEAMSREENELLMWHSTLKQQHTNHTLLQVNGNSADFCLQLQTEDYAELLLDTITSQVGHASRSEFSHSTGSSVSKLDEFSVPDPPDGQELSPTTMYEGIMSSSMTDASPLEIDKNITEQCTGHMVQDTLRVSSSEIKRRCRKVELHRSRPRDRQLIQDRMKELRELIPNASKCSMDALLDKTVTYMQFLQSVSEKAEKIHNILDGEEHHDEIKKQLESFPLRAEELDGPGQFLIEMLCEDYELFLDMAHVLKGLEVNILKGVLEHRPDKPLARFVIEEMMKLQSHAGSV